MQIPSPKSSIGLSEVRIDEGRDEVSPIQQPVPLDQEGP